MESRKKLKHEWFTGKRFYALIDEPIRIYFDYQEEAYPDEWVDLVDKAISLFEEVSTISTAWKDGLCEILDFNVFGHNLMIRRRVEPIDSFKGDGIWNL